MRRSTKLGSALIIAMAALFGWSSMAVAQPDEPDEEDAENTEQQMVDAPDGADSDGLLRLEHRDTSWRWLLGGQLFSMTGGTIWYVLDEETNAVDWDYTGWYSDDPELELRPQSEVWRGLDGWRFDDNVMVLNTPLHPLAGSGYYLLARSSSLGMLGSFLAANSTSMFWETVIEHQEVVSVNDLIYTGVGGFPIGEFYYQLGQFFRHSEQTRLNRALSWVFGLPLQLRDAIHGTSPDPGVDLSLGDRGWPTDIWHQFVLHSGAGRGMTADGYLELGASAQLARLPDYRGEGEHDQWLTGPLQSSLAASVSANGDYVHNWKIDARLDMAGYYRHDVSADAGQRQGTSLFLGTGMGFRHIQHWYQPEPLADGDFLSRYGIVHLPGLRLDFSWMNEHADIHLKYAALPDVTSIDSVAYPEFEQATGREAPRTVLADERYYYGVGLSNLLRIDIDMAPAHFHGDLAVHWSRSINSLDRFKDDPERFGDDLDGYLTLVDRITSLELGAMFDLPLPDLRAGIVGQMRRHHGVVRDGAEEWDADRHDMRFLGTLRLVY